MTTPATVRTIEQWRLHNDEYLATALAWLRSRLDALGRPDGSIAPGDDETKRLYEDLLEAEQSSPPPAIVLLSAAFDLSRFEQEVVLLCAAMELDTRLGTQCAAATGDPARPYPTFALAMALLDEPNWTALSPVGALRRWRLVELDDHPLERLTRRSLRADERVLHFVKGLNVLDERLARLLRRLDEPSGALPPSQQAVADAVVRAVLDSPGQVRQLVGSNRASTRSIARAAASQLGLSLYELPVGALPASAVDIELFARLWEREARLLLVAIVVDAAAGEPGDALELAIARLAEVTAAPVFLTRPVVCTGLTAASTVHDVATPTPAEQRDLWHHAVADDTGAGPARLAGEFDFDASEIERVGAALRDDDRPAVTPGPRARP